MDIKISLRNGDTENIMRKQKGFSLIELLIVVAIILIIAAIAIPNLLRARMAANESSAVSAIRTVNTAEVAYQSAYPTTGYAITLRALGSAIGATCLIPPPNTDACFIDAVLANDGQPANSGKSGYTFSSAGTGVGQSQYYVGGSPLALGSTGNRSFCSYEDAVVRFNPAGAPIAARATCVPLNPLQ
jgi:type IV pilus assembly protein PilA